MKVLLNKAINYNLLLPLPPLPLHSLHKKKKKITTEKARWAPSSFHVLSYFSQSVKQSQKRFKSATVVKSDLKFVMIDNKKKTDLEVWYFGGIFYFFTIKQANGLFTFPDADILLKVFSWCLTREGLWVQKITLLMDFVNNNKKKIITPW